MGKEMGEVSTIVALITYFDTVAHPKSVLNTPLIDLNPLYLGN